MCIFGHRYQFIESGGAHWAVCSRCGQLHELQTQPAEKINAPPRHTVQEDFEHFLAYSGLGSEEEVIKNKLFTAYEAARESSYMKMYG